MFAPRAASASFGKPDLYREMAAELHALLSGEADVVANLANASALIFDRLPDLNWAGFYRLRGETLVLGPFQGKPACVRIPVGQGVCGSAVARRESIVVPDVHAFPGHIACDSASNAELVVPLVHTDGSVFGVLDLDSQIQARFDADDQAGCEALAAIIVRHLTSAVPA
ncbi:MAG TPA: GAF domain-containing protein [Rhodopila sp.]|uniref:GAF domain-containing protein n=1 Tax=Rhodopila sp. TaxID=2480087 RepID=UPI002BA0017B|nr:GAF domain-containing protein [Rhodopila sp.]HVY14133.1 GAF domain-containing protein [Rhodopila sp.]